MWHQLTSGAVNMEKSAERYPAVITNVPMRYRIMKLLILKVFNVHISFPWQSSMRLPTQNITKSYSSISGSGLSLVKNIGYEKGRPKHVTNYCRAPARINDKK